MPRYGGSYASEERSDNDDYIYYNIVISNPSNSLLPMQYNDTRTDIMIPNPGDYYVSIIRFEIPGRDIPITIWPGVIPPFDVPSITLSYGATLVKVELVYIPVIYPATSTSPSTSDQTSPYYYYIYDYDVISQMVNNALATALTTLKGSVPALASADPPYIYYDPVTQLYELDAPQEFYDNSLSNYVKIFFNYRLEGILSGFYEQGNTINQLDPNGRDYWIKVVNLGNNLFDPPFVAPVPGSPSYIRMVQQYNTINLMNSLTSLVIETSNIPVRKEYIPASNTNITNQTSSSDFRKILTDFIPSLENSGANQSYLIYNALGPWRVINMIDSEAIRNLDVKISWQDRVGGLHQLLLYPNDVFSIKFVFIKKSVYNKIGIK